MIGGRYRPGRVIGRGGMGEVFLAEDTLLDREVAIKHIVETDEDHTTATQRLLREARSAARIHHPNVVAVHDLVVEGNDAYIVMEYVAAENLARVLRRGPIGPERAAHIGAQVADALAAAHRLGIVHRDVKPSNILLDGDDHAKLTDFGVARTAGDTGLTRTGHMIGSIAYMPPEIARGTTATPASDLFSLGATLFAAVEGHSPFAGNDDSSTSVAMLVRLVTETAPPATKAGPLTDVIARLLSPDPDSRPDAAEAAAELRSAPAARAVPSPDAPDQDEDTDDESGLDTVIRKPVAPSPASGEREVAAVAPAASPTDDLTVRRLPAPVAPTPALPEPVRGDPSPDPDNPETQDLKRPRRTRLVAAVIGAAALLGIGVVVAYPTVRDSQVAVKVADTTYTRAQVESIAQGLANHTLEVDDSAADFEETVVGILVESRIGKLVMADRKTMVSVQDRGSILDGNTTLAELIKDPATADFASDYIDTAACMSDSDFEAAFDEKATSTAVWVDPRYGVWDPASGHLVTPTPSASPS